MLNERRNKRCVAEEVIEKVIVVLVLVVFLVAVVAAVLGVSEAVCATVGCV